MLNIKIITGSTRPGRFNIQPAEWITKIAASTPNVKAELLDLQKINLPFIDEPNTPMHHNYTKPHTIAWSKKIAEADGFVLVTPEYNHSFSAVLKNALDCLLIEWYYKPVTFVSYGSLAGGSRAVEHLRGVAAELKMYDLREQVMLPNYWHNLNDKGEFIFSEEHTNNANTMLKSLAFWAKIMKAARQKLT